MTTTQAATTIVRSPGGKARHEVTLDTVQVPDAWHAYAQLRNAGKHELAHTVIETWNLAHDLLWNLREREKQARANSDEPDEIKAVDWECAYEVIPRGDVMSRDCGRKLKVKWSTKHDSPVDPLDLQCWQHRGLGAMR